MLHAERDLLLMSAVIFLPTLFAVILLFIPKGLEEVMRWVSLFGTAFTLVACLFLMIDFLNWENQYRHNQEPETQKNANLINRAEKYAEVKHSATQDVPNHQDMIGKQSWIKRFNIEYYLGVDGISMPLIVLTGLIFFLSMIASWNIDRHVRGYCILFLLLETGVLGTFLSLDFFLFFVFWEVMLLPMYFLIGVWGGPNREYAAVKFFLYTMLGSVFILISMLGFYFTNMYHFVDAGRREMAKTSAAEGQPATVNSFDLMVLQRAGTAASVYLKSYHKALGDKTGDEAAEKKAIRTAVDEVAAKGLLKSGDKAALVQSIEANKGNVFSFFSVTGQFAFFFMLFVGFAIKVPIFPFHTWLPDAHVEAPTPISMILAGILLKLGAYGILRIAYPICPWAAETAAWWLALIGIINIVYGALAAMAQKDFKKLVAYSSISHMGYVILGIAVWQVSAGTQYWSWGINGAMYQMIAHGISSAGMFFLVGVIYDRAHHRNLDNFRGLYEPMPLYGGISAIIFFAALGLPGLCGFVGEAFVVLATWNFSKPFAFLAALTVVITAAYILWTLQRVYFGVNPAYKDYPDINLRELLCIIPLCVLAIALGVYPPLLLAWMEPTVTGLVHQLWLGP